MCAPRRLKSACASEQFDQNLHCPYEETLHTWLSKMRPVKILIRLHNAHLLKGTFSDDAHTRIIGLDKSGYQVNIFLISRRKHMLLVLIRSASARRF